MPAADLSQLKAQPETPAEPTKLAARTAFLVFQDMDGRWSATEDLKLSISLERTADADDFVTGAGKVHSEMVANMTASMTVVHLNQQMAAQIQAARAAQLGQGLNLPGL